MIDYTVNGANILLGEVTRPRVGAWLADLVVDSDRLSDFQDAPLSLQLGPGRVFKGWAVRAGLHHAQIHLRIVGGAGGLGDVLPPRAFSNATAAVILRDALTACGETLSPQADPAAASTFFASWVRVRQPLGAELGALVPACGLEAWRVMPDGTVWLGKETWGASDPARMGFVELEFEPGLGRLTFVCDELNVDPGMVFSAPGESYDGQKVSLVSTVISEGTGEVRHVVLFDDGTGTDRLTGGLSSYLSATVVPTLDRSAAYWAKVVSQNGDGTVEVIPDSPRLPSVSKVPIRLGIPGVTVKVAPGARCVLEFLEGDPTRPVVTLWGTTSVLEMDLSATLITLNGGVLAIARATDPVVAGPFAGTVVGPGNVTVLG